MTANNSANHFRTVKGTHRHADRHCANFRRSIHLGDVIEMTEAEAAEFAPCEVCTAPGEVAAHAARATEAASLMCPNEGVRKPRHIQSECRNCGKRGTVNRSTGRLRAHKPA